MARVQGFPSGEPPGGSLHGALFVKVFVHPGAGFRQGWRLLVITHLLTTHGMGALAVRMHLFTPYAWLMRIFLKSEVSRDFGVQLRLMLERLGPTFIKFGQMLSARVDLLPLDVALELKKLQDAVPPEDFTTIRGVLERVFRKPLLGDDGVFRSFEETPTAAASIAQVHFAELHDGRPVAVKVRRPAIRKTIEADLALLQLLAKLFDRYVPEYRRLKAPCVVEEFAVTIRGELNLRAEAAHASRFAENLSAVDGVYIPTVIWDYTRAEALTTERIAGISIDEKAELMAAGHDCLKLCERAASLFFYMAFVDGYFHADMHPGNIFVAGNGDIILVDFGIVGRLDMKSRRYLAEMLLAFLKKDYHRAAMVHLDAGYVPPATDMSAFEDALREIAEPIFNRPLADISLAELLFSMFAVTERFQMETQPQLLLLQKTMVVIEGVARELADQANIWEMARPMVAEWVAKHLGPAARLQQGAEDVRAGLEGWLELPARIEQVLTGRGSDIFVPSVSGSSLWQRMGGIVCVAGGSMAAMQYAAGPWYLPAGVLATVVGAGLLLRR
ncbi:MAG: 2-polyprenylphenol 6-hydroxylase [Mariprofundaceae bacterium]|nr:2-polyprenylphenol 6-hydroxylase [Mariprofundaceae bacterium]